MLELSSETLAVLNGFGLDLLGLRHGGEQEDHAEGIVEITEGICKGGVAFLDDVVQCVNGLVFGQGLSRAVLSLGHHLGHLLGERLVFAELAQDGLVHQVLDVLGIVECRGCCRALVGLLLVLGLAGVDTLENTQATIWIMEIGVSFAVVRSEKAEVV